MSHHLEDDVLGEPGPTVTGHEYDDWHPARHSGRRPMLAIAAASLAVLCFAIAVSRGWI